MMAISAISGFSMQPYAGLAWARGAGGLPAPAAGVPKLEMQTSLQQLNRGWNGLVSQMDAGQRGALFGSRADRIGELSLLKPAMTAQEALAQDAALQRDEAMLAHMCSAGCGCLTSPSGGRDVLRAFEDRDREVREHENEHLVNAGEHARGGPVFETYTASNGQSFVTGGKVEVDLSESTDPARTAQKMAKIRRAALAPRSPSAQDRAVEAEAARKEAIALSQLQTQR